MAAPGHSQTVKTRFLVVSDTHNAVLSTSNTSLPFRFPLPRADVLLHCGDLTMIGHLEEYRKTISMLKCIDAELKLVIAGNHDISLDGEYYARKGQDMHRLLEPDNEIVHKAREMWVGEEAREAGVTYLDEGTYSFTLSNGARLRVYASPYQPEFCDWAFPYERHEDRFNPAHLIFPPTLSIAQNLVPDFPGIDLMMTHGPPFGILDKVVGSGGNVGCQHLLKAARRARPRLHCFGHIHEGWGAAKVKWKNTNDEQVVETAVVDYDKMVQERGVCLDLSEEGEEPLAFGKETIMVNASIMNVSYRPFQGPWLVDLDLERA